MFMPPTNHSAAIQESWSTKIGHKSWPTFMTHDKHLLVNSVGQLLLVVCHGHKAENESQLEFPTHYAGQEGVATLCKLFASVKFI